MIHLFYLIRHGGINMAGVAMAAVGFGTTFFIQELVGAAWSVGLLTMIAGPQIVLLDLVYRCIRPERNWWSFRAGGSLLFLPAWQLGAIWFGMGAGYLFCPAWK